MPRKVNPKTAATRLRRASPLRPRLAMVLGSGFHCVAAAMEEDAAVPYTRLPGFPKAGVVGHRGEALIGTLGGTPVLVLNGRSHFYEGHSLAETTFPIRVLAACGVESVLLTNAAGGINRKFRPGDFMKITDHINLMPDNPLRGPVPAGCERFIDLSRAYNPGLAGQLQAAARAAKVRLRKGIYLALPGPNYESLARENNPLNAWRYPGSSGDESWYYTIALHRSNTGRSRANPNCSKTHEPGAARVLQM